MSTWVWILIVAAAVLIVAMVAWGMMKRKQTKQLQSQFGSEYDRTVEAVDNKKTAESELVARRERREQLDIRPLSSAARERYVQQWQIVQVQFVDNPSGAVASADQLIQSVMADRGYPVKDFETRASDVSVDHPDVVENYRHGHRLAQKSVDGDGSTEDLRQAMRHYRALFDDLVEPTVDEPMARERDDAAASADTNSARRDSSTRTR
ncbi:MAG TPA: hypothetical protein VF232_00030 [Gaiellaceae bacterium]